jgi:hypothetical protein
MINIVWHHFCNQDIYYCNKSRYANVPYSIYTGTWYAL